MTDFIISPSEWSEEVEKTMNKTYPKLSDSAFEFMKNSSVFRVTCDGETVAFFCLAIDGDEGVMFGAAATGKSAGLYDLCLPYAESLFRGVSSIRAHVERPGAARVLGRHGYTAQEIVMRKAVKNVG